jgi:hypothetical protein
VDLGALKRRTRGVRRTVIASLLTMLLVPAPAAAGGWWTYVDTDRSTVAPGQRVNARAEVLFSSIEAAQDARDEAFYVYAVRGLDRSMVVRAMNKPFREGWWSLGDAEAVELGRVALHISDGNLAWARASFTVPELAPATYALMLCDAGCARPLADIVPTPGFTVMADPATANLARRADRLEERVARQAALLAAARRVARAAAANTRSEREAIDERLRGLSRQVERAVHSPRPSPWAFAGWLVTGVLLGALGSLLLRRRRAAKAPASVLTGWQPSDDELRDRLASGSSPRTRRASTRR